MDRHDGAQSTRTSARRSRCAAAGTMVAIIVLLLVPAPPARAIVGGTHAAPGQFPFVSSAPDHYCTGSLIAPTWVLTAAHCSALTTEVLIGTTERTAGGERATVKRAIPHPDYDLPSPTPPYLAYDIMLFELTAPSTGTVVPIARPDQADLQAPGREATDIGFGLPCDPPDPGRADCLDFESLRFASFPIIDTPTCQGANPAYASVDPATMVCTLFPGGGVSPCYGDSGGPLIVYDNGKPVQIGVVSGGLDPCGRPDGPAVYTRVSAYAAWLTSVTGIDFVTPPTTSTTTPSSSSTSTSSTAPVVVATPRFTG